MNLKIIKYDFLQIGRDPMLIMSVAVPAILWLLLEFVFPLTANLAMRQWGIDIQEYFMPVSVFFMVLIPMMLGMVYGFILLDERDGGMIMAISVTPLGKNGYILLRMGLPVAYSFVCIMLFYILLGTSPQLTFGQHALLSLVLSLNAPIMLLFLGAFAGNKVEGLAISKGFGLLLIAVPIGYFAPAPYHWLGAYSPLFWIGKAYFTETLVEFSLYFMAGMVFHLILLFLLYKRFTNRRD
jgi:fluoroquinolone transport system permease protein